MTTIFERVLQTPDLGQETVSPFRAEESAGSIAIEGSARPNLATDSLAYSELIPRQLWGRLTARIEQDEDVGNELAQRMINETLGFLKACGENPGVALSPSERVDAGWHTFILYTREYADFCINRAGEFIHHSPTDSEESDSETMTITGTLNFLLANGYRVDRDLWQVDGQKADDARCSSHCRNTCGRH